MKNKIFYNGPWNDEYVGSESNNINYKFPSSFCKFGLAELYYKKSFDYLLDSYPYDGSWYERRQWFESLMPWDRFFFNKIVPKSTGYLVFSPNGIGDIEGVYYNNRIKSPVKKEYILFYGGPHRYGDRPYDSNKITSSVYQKSNLSFGAENTIEFFLKPKQEMNTFSDQEIQCILDVWNQKHYTSSDYRRMFLLVSYGVESTIDVGFYFGSNFYSVSLRTKKDSGGNYLYDGNWHFYSITISFVEGDFLVPNRIFFKLFVDGEKVDEKYIDISTFERVESSLVASIGGFLGEFDTNTADMPRGAGKFSGSIDEFRFFHYVRDERDIRSFSKTNIFGGTNTDDENLGLGIYYKFNEGVSGIPEIDSKIVDYSGRKSNGVFVGYEEGNRSTSSAFEEFYEKIFEPEEMILYKEHDLWKQVYSLYERIGLEYDTVNLYNVFRMLPKAFVEMYDTNELREFCHIIGSFFDYMLINIKTIHYDGHSSLLSHEIYSSELYKRYLNSIGVPFADLFSLPSWQELMLGVTDDRSFMDSVEKIKRIILANISSNAMILLKSKGSINAFLSSLRHFGISEDIVDIKKYSVQKFVDTEHEATVPKYYRRSVFSSFDNPELTITHKALPGGVWWINTANGDDALRYSHSFLCEFFTPAEIPDMSDISVFGAKDKTTGASLFDVRIENKEKSYGFSKFVFRFPLFGIDTTWSSSKIYNLYEANRYVACVQTYADNSSYVLSEDGLQNFYLQFNVYKINDLYIECIESFKINVNKNIVSSFFQDNEILFYCGADRNIFSGELIGNVSHYTCLDFSDFRYVTFRVDENVLSKICFEDVGNTTVAVFAQNQLSKQSNCFSNVFIWNPRYVLKNSSYYSSLLDNSVFDSSADSFVEAIANNFYYQVVFNDPENNVLRIVKDKYCSGFSKEILEDNKYSGETFGVKNFECNKFFRSSKNFSSFYTIEKSLSQLLNHEIFLWFSDVLEYYSLFNFHQERFSYLYRVLPSIKEQFFLMVEKSEIDFNNFFEYYKWIDSAVLRFLSSFLPYFVGRDTVFSVVENHALSREKIPQKRIAHASGEESIFGCAIGGLYFLENKKSFLEYVPIGIEIRPVPSYYRNNYDILSVSGRNSNSNFYIRFPKTQNLFLGPKLYTKDYFKLPYAYLRVFYDSLYSPLNYEQCYNNFVTETERKRGKSVFVNKNGERDVFSCVNSCESDAKSLEISAGGCINFKFLFSKKKLNYSWGGSVI